MIMLKETFSKKDECEKITELNKQENLRTE